MSDMAKKTHEERLFGAACVKLSLDDSNRDAGELYRGVLSDLGVSDEEVRAYIAKNRDLVARALKNRGREKPS